jgi:hypothetical protein
VNRIEEKEGKKGMLAYLTSFILEPLGGRLGAEVKLGFLRGSCCLELIRSGVRRHKTPFSQVPICGCGL